ncbi:MAG TPA: hypothetical protein VGN35_13590 [Jatrophihabitantaceae bacterium]|nr:hypothetical protein [Jatrophihabitantaceae bacterium]
MTDPTTLADGQARALGVDLFNGARQLLRRTDRTVDEDDAMLHMAHASRHHWAQVGTEANLARGEWLCSRVYAALGRGEPATHHAQRVLDICARAGIADWDLAFAFEALARAAAVSGDPATARAYTERALEAAQQIAEDDDRELLLSDLETIPGQQRFW